MSTYTAPLSDMRFLLHHVFKLGAFCETHAELSDLDIETADAILEEAAKLCEQKLAPLDTVGDQKGCTYVDEEVRAPEGFIEAYKEFSDGSWGALGGDTAYGGMGLPKQFVATVEEMVQGSNMAFGLAPMLTAGACLALLTHGSDELKNRFLAKMYSGEWSGAMDLTEPHAGTDLGLIRTKAQANGDGSYAITGTKIFITWGDHDLAENIVHLVLAKLPDAPPGSKGISMFLIPKFLPEENGSLGARNPVSCGAIEHKMGIHGSATCVMNFDAAKGWLVGEAHQGLACMFTMMNYERLVVGIQGLGVAEKSYQCARNYALDRVQGRAPQAARDTNEVADPIIVHPDVRRMLLEMKSMNEAGRAFYIYVASWLDRAKFEHDAESQKLAEDRVALLTPVAKAFITDRALEACVHGQQVLGGHGYIAEWGQDQRVRDVRITQIYEGTNGIQAMDLIGRKIVQSRGLLLEPYLAEMRDCVSGRPLGLDQDLVDQFLSVLETLESLTHHLVAHAEPELAGAVATDYLDLLGYCSYAYMWMLMMSASVSESRSLEFTDAKLKTGRFFFAKMLPMAESLAARIQSDHTCLSVFEDSEF